MRKAILITLAASVLVVVTAGIAIVSYARLYDEPSLPPRIYIEDCDQILRSQLVFQRGAKTAKQFTDVAGQITDQRDCGDWGPIAINADLPGQCGALPLALRNRIGAAYIPHSLLDANDPQQGSTPLSSRDTNNNLLIHWKFYARPQDQTLCWMYIDSHKLWVSE